MKPALMRWLATVILLSVNTGAKAQFGGMGGPLGVQLKQNENPIPQAGQIQSVPQMYSWVTPQLQVPNQPGQLNYNWMISGDQLGWIEPFDRTAGMGMSPADDALRAHLSLPKDQGLIVTSLAPNAPAAQAGVQQNDVLLKLGDTLLAKAEDLEECLKAAGDKAASLTILRGGKKLTIPVQPRVRATMGPVQPEPPAFWIGVSVSPLEPALRAQLKLPQNMGLLATDVVKDSPAAKADVKVHDILLSLDGKQLDSQEKLVELVQSSGDKSVPLELIREGKPQTIFVMPQRRQTALQQAIAQTGNPVYFQVGQPGAVLTFEPNLQVFPNGAVTRLNPDGMANVTGLGDLNLTGSSKRLDDLDAEIKQLRRAIEELSKALKEKN
jgi:membrane-associated protease RseP (regulator of RpoE activity)